MNKLNHHLRQYRHNNKNVLVHGYEEKGTEAFVSCLESEIAELKKQIADLTLVNAGVNSRLTNSVDLHNAVVIENNELKAQFELLRDELSCFASQHGCQCGHPSCSKCKDTDDTVKLLLKTPRQFT